VAGQETKKLKTNLGRQSHIMHNTKEIVSAGTTTIIVVMHIYDITIIKINASCGGTFLQ